MQYAGSGHQLAINGHHRHVLVRFEIAQCSSALLSCFGSEGKAGTPPLAPESASSQWTKWFGGGSAAAGDGKITKIHRKGCAVVACFGKRLKNIIGIHPTLQ
jgi:hypothetical protein